MLQLIVPDWLWVTQISKSTRRTTRSKCIEGKMILQTKFFNDRFPFNSLKSQISIPDWFIEHYHLDCKTLECSKHQLKDRMFGVSLKVAFGSNVKWSNRLIFVDSQNVIKLFVKKIINFKFVNFDDFHISSLRTNYEEILIPFECTSCFVFVFRVIKDYREV
jgi:hypothetical protein